MKKVPFITIVMLSVSILAPVQAKLAQNPIIWADVPDVAVIRVGDTMPHFMGYRFGLFNLATKTAGGYVDFDYYHVTDEISVD